MILLYAGRRGCGKTTTMVKDAYLFHLQGWPVYTNMSSIGFATQTLDNDMILGLLQDDSIHDVVLALDEIQTFIDSRRSMRQQNLGFTYFIQQIRKRNIIILATTQYVRRVDLAFREHLDVLARPEFKPEYPVIVTRYIDLTSLEDDYGREKEFADEGLVVFDPRSVYPLFNTREVITPIS